jgi:uncharacterized protein
MDILGFLLAVCMGLILGVVGAGGSILAVPILVYFLGVPPAIATGYSLLLVGITALIGSISYYRKQQIDFQTSITFAVPSVIAVYSTRRWLVPAIPDPFFTIWGFVVTKDIFLMLFFAILMLFAAIMMIRDSALKSSITFGRLPATVLIGIEGAVVGVFTGIIGAGGGFLIIPTLVLLAGLEMKVAVGSSLLIIAVKSLFGFIGDLQAGIPLNYGLIGLFLACAISGMLLGTLVSQHVIDNKLKKAFGWFILVMGIIILFKEL